MKEVLSGYWMVKTKENVHEYVLQCIPEAGLAWLHFLDESGKEVARQEQLFGQWEIVGVVAEIPESVAAAIVKCTMPKVRGAKVQMAFYKNYENEHSSYSHATESLLSLARSHGFEPDQAILLKLTNK